MEFTPDPFTSAGEPDIDVLVIGAGPSGLGFASRLNTEVPGKSMMIVDAHEDVGGTWHLFRYPGIRSDSDLITYGYQYKPWMKEKAIAPGAEIKGYLRETVEEYDLAEHLRLGTRVERLNWSSTDSVWEATLCDIPTGRTEVVRARFVVSGTGYFDHEEGYRPRWEGEQSFGGTLLHAQEWEEDMEVDGKRVVVIGSGATAVTMLPALAEQGASVTMLQRSPSYVVPLPSKDVVFDVLKRFVAEDKAFTATRRANIERLRTLVRLSKRYPDAIRALLRQVNKAFLPSGFDVDTHFNPTYGPWDERMCIVPDGDFYRAIRSGNATVATDTIKRFTTDGIELESGQFLAADIVVAATGLKVLPFGGIAVSVDGNAVDWTDSVAYKSLMIGGLPNFLFGFGYTNNSWTLKIDLASDYLARLLRLMDERGVDTVIPHSPADDVERADMILDLSSGYIRRAVDVFPRQVQDSPWSFQSDYGFDRARLGAEIDDGTLEFRCSEARSSKTGTEAAA